MAQRSKWFRVALEGATTDGRVIQRNWIQEAADSYDPELYSARVWLEHFRAIFPDSAFRAYGDVLALKAEEVEIAGKKKLALFAQIEPTADLLALNKAKQKLFTSIEINPKFADTGKAYMDGLGITDSPASLGTQMLQFCAQNPDASPLAARKTHPDNLISEAIEVALEFEDVTEPEANKGMFTRLGERLTGIRKKFKQQDQQLGDAVKLIEDLIGVCEEQAEVFATQIAASDAEFEKLQTAFTKLQSDHDTLVEKLRKTDDHKQKERPAVTGDTGTVRTDC